MTDGRRAVLKASPDRSRLALEAAALTAWHTDHAPAVIAFDEQLGALLLEAIEPGTPLIERDPQLNQLIPSELYERGHALAIRLAQHTLPVVLLHGDLTPRNILDGGAERGLVAIDPTPCRGDAAFDAVDLILWQARAMWKRSTLASHS